MDETAKETGPQTESAHGLPVDVPVQNRRNSVPYRSPNKIRRKRRVFKNDASRVICRFFNPGGEKRIARLAERLEAMHEEEVSDTIDAVLHDFSDRHRDLEHKLLEHCHRVAGNLPLLQQWSPRRRLLLGAYLTQEYSIEAASLFNPSIVLHPCQDDLPADSVRFLISFRATGEGHLSSIVFRSGTIDKRGTMALDAVPPFVELPAIELNPTYHKHTFFLKLRELGAVNDFSRRILSQLDAYFQMNDLLEATRSVSRHGEGDLLLRETVDIVMWMAQSNYEVSFRPEAQLSERVIFPVAQDESHGMEDARFVRFVDDDDSVTYYATYTAYNGHTIAPMMLSTRDFVSFRMRTLNGRGARDKGMALFPRKIGGRYMMISRLDGENTYLMRSDNLHFWNEAERLSAPTLGWELVQVGNCGSPLETEAGWLHLTHGVGPLRQYCIGIELRDLDDPAKLIGKLPEPLIVPDEREREGYVPNVVYTCGAMIYGDNLIVPYSMSDTSAGVATVRLGPLLDELLAQRGDSH